MTNPTNPLEPDAPQTAHEFIEMRGISKRFGGVRALIDVSFSIRAAEIHCLAGENGCGKSTLIKILSGVHAPDEGQIILEGKPHSHLSPAASQRFGVQIIYQDLSLFPNLSVAENIAFGHHVQMPVRLADPKAMRKHAQAVMERLKISLPLEALVGTLPIATRQLVGNWLVAFGLAAGFGILLGVVNALLIYYLRALAVIVTISMMTFYFTVLMFVTDGKSIYNLPDWFTADLSLFGIPFPVVVAAIVLLVTVFLLSRLSIGRQIYGLGGNPEAGKRMGCNLLGLQCFVYGYSGFMAGIAGLVQAHRVEEVVPNALIGRELDVLAAVVLGGASLLGGVGTVSGTVLGIVLLAILQNGLTLLGVSSYSFGFVTGLVILMSVSATAYAAKHQQKQRVRHAN